MSTTSTTYSRHRKRRGGRGEDETDRIRNNVSLRSRDYHTDGDIPRQKESEKWSANKLKHELSSFIAEFSYLTDNAKKSQNNTTPIKEPQNANRPQNNVQVYAVRKERFSSPFVDPGLGRKGVEWEDQNRGVMVYGVQDEAFCNDKPKRGRPRVVRHAVFRHRAKVRVDKSRSVRRSTSRDLSCPLRRESVKRVRRRFSGFRVSKSRSKCRSRKGRSSRSAMPMRRRVRSRSREQCRTTSQDRSRSNVRNIPFRFKQRRRTREIVIKRSKPKIVYKAIEPCAEPTLITLYPKPIRRRPRRIPSKEPGLPCKCDMCTNKYRSLARLYQDPRLNPSAPLRPPIRPPMRPPNRFPCLPICSPCPQVCAPCPQICAPCPQICTQCPPTCEPCAPMCSPCPAKCQDMPKDCRSRSPNRSCNTGCMKCKRPCGNQCTQCYNENCCETVASRCVNSVCYKFGAMSQSLNLNSSVTHYFHSILDRRACC